MTMYLNHAHPKQIEDMFKAVDEQDVDNIRFYVTDGADPDQKNEKGFTLLQHAMIHRKYDSAEALLEMGADPDIAVEAHGETPLHYAAREGNAHLIGVMLHKLADVNKADGFGWTPLHTATACGKLDAIRELVEHGADLNLKDCQRDRPIDLAVLRQNHMSESINKPFPPIVAYLKEKMEEKHGSIAPPEERRALMAQDMERLRQHNPDRFKLRP
ncbi:MAG: ankyrin repeat domain-containing protein [bacterium]|nr:ankyrin repeat domain-containing protein [bacterium]